MRVRIDDFGVVNLPDFFIVGAPKSGTTSLHYYLQGHPQIFMPDKKESWFFSFMNDRPFFNSPDKFPGIIDSIDISGVNYFVRFASIILSGFPNILGQEN